MMLVIDKDKPKISLSAELRHPFECKRNTTNGTIINSVIDVASSEESGSSYPNDLHEESLSLQKL